MRNTLAVLEAALTLALAPCLVFPQEGEPAAPIKAFKSDLGWRYTYHAIPVSSWADFESIMKGNPDAVALLHKARTRSKVASVLGSVGGFLIGGQSARQS